jgi:hypothetical protein
VTTHEAPRPVQHLRELATKYPKAWKQYQGFRENKASPELGDWPSWCYVPLAAAYTIVSGGGENRVAPDAVQDVGILGALAAWRMTQGIYRIDHDLFAELWDSPIMGDVPVECLFRLCEWCVYVEVPPGSVPGPHLHGFYVHLEHDMNDHHAELRLVLDCDGGLVPFPVHLFPGRLEALIKAMVEESAEVARREGLGARDPRSLRSVVDNIAHLMEPLISVLLYLCTDDVELVDPAGRKRKPGPPVPIKTAAGYKVFTPSTPTTWDVGFKMGAALRAARQKSSEGEGEGSHASPRPHVRRAHWYAFWYGPKASPEKRTLRLRWLHPMLVSTHDPEELIPTVHQMAGNEDP